MRTWEYMILDSKTLVGGGMFKGKTREAVEAFLNQLGAEGWEIVEMNFREIQRGFEFTGLAKREISD